eukprot:m.363612 g.363612  ORF g.363612 m.363612 type:complete len:52 (-) comp23183_c0_seq1:74-229(-)
MQLRAKCAQLCTLFISSNDATRNMYPNGKNTQYDRASTMNQVSRLTSQPQP